MVNFIKSFFVVHIDGIGVRAFHEVFENVINMDQELGHAAVPFPKTMLVSTNKIVRVQVIHYGISDHPFVCFYDM